MEFDALFRDGYTLRHLIDYLKMTVVNGNFVMGDDSITFQRTNGSNTILNEVEIRTCDISYYKKDPNKDSIIGITLNEFAKNTKPIGKKDGFRIFREEGAEMDRVSCQHICSTAQVSSGSNISYIFPKKIMHDPMYVGFSKSESKPNYTMSITEFSKACSNVLSFGCTKIYITGYAHGIKIEGFDSRKNSVVVNKFGRESDTNITPGLSELSNAELNNVPITEIPVDNATLKAFGKINSISAPSSNIKLYFEEDVNAMKIIFFAGCYGIVRVCLRPPDDEEVDEEVDPEISPSE